MTLVHSCLVHVSESVFNKTSVFIKNFRKDYISNHKHSFSSCISAAVIWALGIPKPSFSCFITSGYFQKQVKQLLKKQVLNLATDLSFLIWDSEQQPYRFEFASVFVHLSFKL